MKNPRQVAEKWAKNLSMSTDSIKQGVQAVTVSPMEKAAARQDAYVNGVQRAAASGKWQRGLRRKNLGDWQTAMTGKGLQRISGGATAAIPAMDGFMSQWLPYEDQLKTKLASMPRGDFEQNKQRAIAAMEHNHQFVRQ